MDGLNTHVPFQSRIGWQNESYRANCIHMMLISRVTMGNSQFLGRVISTTINKCIATKVIWLFTACGCTAGKKQERSKVKGRKEGKKFFLQLLSTHFLDPCLALACIGHGEGKRSKQDKQARNNRLERRAEWDWFDKSYPLTFLLAAEARLTAIFWPIHSKWHNFVSVRVEGGTGEKRSLLIGVTETNHSNSFSISFSLCLGPREEENRRKITR